MKASNLFKHISSLSNPKLIKKLRKLDGFTVIKASPEKITLVRISIKIHLL
jgi:hypothetical protein